MFDVALLRLIGIVLKPVALSFFFLSPPFYSATTSEKSHFHRLASFQLRCNFLDHITIVFVAKQVQRHFSSCSLIRVTCVLKLNR